jgi:hypothetical protein
MALMVSASEMFLILHLSKRRREDKKVQPTADIELGVRAIGMLWFGLGGLQGKIVFMTGGSGGLGRHNERTVDDDGGFSTNPPVVLPPCV